MKKIVLLLSLFMVPAMMAMDSRQGNPSIEVRRLRSDDHDGIRGIIYVLIGKFFEIRGLMNHPLFEAMPPSIQEGIYAVMFELIQRASLNAHNIGDGFLIAQLHQIRKEFFPDTMLRSFLPRYNFLRDSGYIAWFKASIEDKSIYSEIAELSRRA